MLRFLTISIAISLAYACTANPSSPQTSALKYHISPTGSDSNIGSKDKPFKTISHARNTIRKNDNAGKKPITVNILSGKYYIPDTIRFTALDSGSKEAPITYQAQGNVVISGGTALNLKWKPHRNGIMKAAVPKNFTTDQLFVNGQRQHMARYPDFDPKAKYFNGFSEDCLSEERTASWKNPTGGFIHALHKNLWGSQHYLITGKEKENTLKYEGGWQHHWHTARHHEFRFVENIFEELDTPGEWFLDKTQSTLYYYPPENLNINEAIIEAARLERLFEFNGTEQKPVKHITIRGLTMTHTTRTFMETQEPLNRSDWMICRSGTIFLNGTENCSIENCRIDQVGGNAIFINNYNNNVTVRGCHITESGASGIAFVGDATAVRKGKTLEAMDRTPGPKSNNYPRNCLVEDCLMHDLGRVEKQIAGVHISMAQNITIRHCSIYDTPRAGINISDGCWCGNLIEFCDVFDTVKETSDHGSFNSWGRDRFFRCNGLDPDTITTSEYKNFPMLDMVKPTIIRNSRWSCANGWDIDLDDGSSTYEVYNNLCLAGGIKFREGFYRNCYNNIMVNNTLHPHVWFRNSEDVFEKNIIFKTYKPVGLKDWGKSFDNNLYHRSGEKAKRAKKLQRMTKMDKHSLIADAMFVDPSNLDYRVKEGSPALRLGFKNFPMDNFGVTSKKLKALARTPSKPSAAIIGISADAEDSPTLKWQGMRLRAIEGHEYSAWGVSKEAGGLHVLNIDQWSKAFQTGIKENFLILSINGLQMKSLDDLSKLPAANTYKIDCTENTSGTRHTMKIETTH